MRSISVGDTVRFLNSVGGGRVKGFQSKQIAIVEDEHGFDVPVLVSELVVIKSVEEELEKIKATSDAAVMDENTRSKLGSKPGWEKGFKPGSETGLGRVDKPGTGLKMSGKWESEKSNPMSQSEAERPVAIVETPEGEQITACLAYLPMDSKNISTTAYECYFVNDSNYFLYFNYMSRENNAWKSRCTDLVEPNTKVFVEEFDKTELNEIEKVAVQFIAFKRNKPYAFKNPGSVELRIDTVKFYKLHSFQENDYFEEDALIYYLMREDLPEEELLVSAGDLERAMNEKRRANQPARTRRKRIEQPEKAKVVEVDLHINQLLDTTAGMNNADILEYQLKKFNETMQAHLKQKGKRLVFIHGKGDGVLRQAIVNELKKKYPSCYSQDASFKEYGFGATMVTIK
ncbi:MAG: DUF2027 domain-containing protein [Bacteroidota bacterium]|jgi:hypothetical protein|nr:DUF2027 domain-containing protein [Bacteroidota bacterium]